jgi:hypothetical protein
VKSPVDDDVLSFHVSVSVSVHVDDDVDDYDGHDTGAI